MILYIQRKDVVRLQKGEIMVMYEVVAVNTGEVLARDMTQKVAMLMASALYKRYPTEELR